MDFEHGNKPKRLIDYFRTPNYWGLASLIRLKSERSVRAEERIKWLQSQVIGSDVEFETLFGSRRLTYADHTASGRCLQYIENYIIRQVLPVYGNTHTQDSYVGSQTTKLVRQASDYIKRCAGAGPDDVLLFCGSGSTAAVKRLQEVLGITIPSTMHNKLKQILSDRERWVVFVGPYEHHSNLLSWRRSAAEVVEIGLDGDGGIDMDSLKRELEARGSDRPMLGSFSACSNVTGLVTDTRAVARLLHRHGAFACFDFAASGPYVEIDMRSGDVEGYDAVFLSPHKFVGGPGSPGILLMNKALYQLKSSPPSTCGGGTVAYVNGFCEEDTLYFDDIEKREDSGTPPIIQKIRAALAFWVKEYIGFDLINLKEQVYTEEALRRLLAIPNIVVLGNTRAKRLPIFSFLVFPGTDPSSSSGGRGEEDKVLGGVSEKGKPLHGRFVAKLLNDLFGIQARGGCSCASPYGHHLLGVEKDLSLRVRSLIKKGYHEFELGWTRVSFPYYMPKEEFAFILASIEFIAIYGHRFLSLYRSDWETGDWNFRKQEIKCQLMKEELAVELRDLSRETPTSIPAPPSTPGGRSRNRKVGRSSKKDQVNTGVKARRFESYLEKARKIALSLPDNPPPEIIPDGIDPSLVLYRV